LDIDYKSFELLDSRDEYELPDLIDTVSPLSKPNSDFVRMAGEFLAEVLGR